MYDYEFEQQLKGLRKGELRLEPPSEGGLSQCAAAGLSEMRRYIAALESGYRELSSLVDAYRSQDKVRKATSGKLVRELKGRQWSEGACLGYAAMGMRQAAFSPADTVRVLEAMEDAMEIYGLDDAANAHQDLLEGHKISPPPGHGAHCAPLQKEGEEP